MARGIRERHARSCRQGRGGRCSCEPSFEACVWHPTEGRQLRRTFRDPAEAKGWVRDAKVAIRRGRTVKKPASTVEGACLDWLEKAQAGAIRTAGGDTFKPGTLRAYKTTFNKRVFPAFGGEPLEDVQRADLQEWVDKLNADGLAAATINTTVAALKTVYRHQLARDRIKVNPTVGLDLPAVRNGRDRVAPPAEAAALLAAVPASDRAIWATAFYGGLRRGELMALRAQAIDLKAGEVHVVAGWDKVAGEQATKGRERRKVPIVPTLRTILAQHLLDTGRRDTDLAFGHTAVSPFKPDPLTARADKAWKAAGLNRIVLHECRHTFASIAIAAGVNIGTVSEAMGHSSVVVTWTRYHHLLPGTMDEAATLIQAYLDRPAAESAR